MWLKSIESTGLYQWLRSSMNRQLVNFLRRKALAGRSSQVIAEVACGSGYSAHLLASEPNVALSIAADINLEDRRQANIQDYRAAFVLTDIFRPALQPSSIDLVWNSSSVEELSHPEEAVKSMAALAKPGGWVFVGVPYKYGLGGFLRLFPGNASRAWLGRVYDRTQLHLLMQSAGLNVEANVFYLGWTFIGMLAMKPAAQQSVGSS